MSDAQRVSVFSRASWSGNAHTTVNPFALRKPIQDGSARFHTQTYRMHKANFALDPKKSPTCPARVLCMTPTKEHVAAKATRSLRFPEHTQLNRVKLMNTDNIVSQLVNMRGEFNIINHRVLEDVDGRGRTRRVAFGTASPHCRKTTLKNVQYNLRKFKNVVLFFTSFKYTYDTGT